ncbi:MAG: PLP-dependent transferase [Candidatus Aminicenantes bacterium]|nr:PLP-dependent transferase [Candidatus Aminicenantes bacterium]
MKKIKVHSTMVPIYRDAGFHLINTGTSIKAFKDELDHHRAPENYIYSRYRNPTVVAAEEQLMKLEQCNWALLTQSGLSAIDLALSIFQQGKKTGPWLFFSEIYGGTNSFIDRVLIFRRGLDVRRFYPTGGSYDLGELKKMLDEVKPALVYFECVSNPMVVVADCERIISLAKKSGAVVIVDNTFATPYLWRPLEMGADIVVHSATKYLAGHGDLTAGVVCGNDPRMEKDAIEYRKYIGHMLSPDDAYRLGANLKTFELRMKRHCDNAFKLAGMLAAHDKIEQVHYPGLASHSTHEDAKKLFKGKGFGGMITFDLKAAPGKKLEAAEKFIAAVAEDIPLVPTLGNADTTLLHVESVWGDKYPMPGLIRLSVGIEEYEHLETVIQNGLANID